MEKECLMSEAIDTIVKLLEGTNLKLEGLNSSFMSLHNDLTTFKGDVKASLIDTNGKLKGSHELLSNKLDQFSTDIKRIDKTLGDQIQINHDEILRNKNTIAALYELDRTATKRNDDAHTELIKGIEEKMTHCTTDNRDELKDLEDKLDAIGDITKENRTKTGILFAISGVLGSAIIYGLIEFFTK